MKEVQIKSNGEQKLTEVFKCRLSPQNRITLERFSKLHQRSLNQSIRMGIDALALTMKEGV